jgi:hypothetical protein
MKRMLHAGLLTVACGLVLLPDAAGAQTPNVGTSRNITPASNLAPLPLGFPDTTRNYPAGPCSEGRTISGECVNAGLAESMRQTAIIFSQPKLSQTAYPVLPGGDWLYRYPNQLIPDPLLPPARATPTTP